MINLPAQISEKMKRTFLILSMLSVISIINVYPQKSPKEKGLDAITMDAIRGQLEFLSSDWMEGRATGEKGSFIAASYIASMFKVFGAAPAGDVSAGGQGGRQQQVRSTLRPASSGGIASYFQNFTLIETLPGGQATLSVNKNGKEYTFQENVDFTTGRLSLSTKFDAQVVFVGYGIVDKANGIDDYAGIDVKGKVILRLPGFPGSNDQNSPMYKKLSSGNLQTTFEMTRRKNEIPANLGAAAIIDISTGTDIAKRWGTYMFDYNPAYAESGTRTNWNRMALEGKEISPAPVSLTVTERVINLILKESGIDLEKYEKDAAAGSVKFKPVLIPGLKVSFNAEIKTRRVNVRNIIAMVEGENKDEIVAVGAHMDHMGMDNGKIWNGADDNASGTVGVMTLAKAFVESGVKPKRTIVFCAWTGEEKGLLGSEYFTLYPTVGKISNYKFYLNFDMIARDAANDTLKNMAGITYTKAYPRLEEITKKYIDEYRLNLKLNIRSAEAPTGGSDYTAFTNNKIPVIAWMAAMHPDYHQPSDEVNLVNWNKMLNIIKLAYLQIWEAANGDIR